MLLSSNPPPLTALVKTPLPSLSSSYRRWFLSLTFFRKNHKFSALVSEFIWSISSFSSIHERLYWCRFRMSSAPAPALPPLPDKRIVVSVILLSDYDFLIYTVLCCVWWSRLGNNVTVSIVHLQVCIWQCVESRVFVCWLCSRYGLMLGKFQ